MRNKFRKKSIQSIRAINEHLKLRDSESKDLLQYRKNKVISIIYVNKLNVKTENILKHVNKSEIKPFVKALFIIFVVTSKFC